MKPEEVLGLIALIVLVVFGLYCEFWYETKYKPQRYAEEFQKALHSEKSK